MINRRNFLASVSALAVTPFLPPSAPAEAPSSLGVVDRIERFEHREGGGIPGVYGWGGRYGGTRDYPNHNGWRPRQ